MKVLEEAEKDGKKDESGKTDQSEKKDESETKEEPEKKVESNKEPEEKSENKTDPHMPNGHVVKAKLVNGDASVDSDVTAVNTPGSSTPLPKVEVETQTIDTATAIAVTPDVLRLQTEHLQKLLNFLDKEFSPLRRKLNDLLQGNDIQFNLLWCLFRLGSVITFKDHESGLNMAGEVISQNYIFDARSRVQTICVVEIHKSILKSTCDISIITDLVSIMPGNDCTTL